MLPAKLLDFNIAGGTLRPNFLREPELASLHYLVGEARRLAGRPWRELDQRLAEPSGTSLSPQRLALVNCVLKRQVGAGQKPVVDPKRVRAMLFVAAARRRNERAQVLAEVGERLGISPAAVDDALFADLPGERLVGDMPVDFRPADLLLQTNFALAQALVGKASLVRIKLSTNARAIVRHAQRTGLICLARAAGDGVLLELSGPFAVLRRTLLYARALGGLLPHLAQCDGFALEADCVVSGQSLKLILDHTDPMFPTVLPERYDSQLEARFGADFRRVARDWDLHREPAPIRAGDTFLFPDFAVVHHADASRRWFLEILGFWTQAYLARKLEAYRRAGLANLVLCIDAGRQVDDGEFPAGSRIVRYRRRIDARDVLAAITS